MTKLRKRAFLPLYALLFAGTSSAATLQFDYDLSFGETPADGGPAWLTAFFDDGGSAGSVDVTFTVAGNVGAADITQLYLNLDPSMNPNNLTITRIGGTGPAASLITIDTRRDFFKANGDGLYDILADFDTAQSADRFEAGETLTFSITGKGSASGLVAGDFNFFSVPDGGTGPFLAAAKVQSTGPSPFEGSDWIAPNPIPVPAAVWLFGSALGVLGWLRRRVVG